MGDLARTSGIFCKLVSLRLHVLNFYIDRSCASFVKYPFSHSFFPDKTTCVEIAYQRRSGSLLLLDVTLKTFIPRKYAIQQVLK